MRLQVGRIFRRFDVVLAPTTARPPMPVGTIDGLSGWETDKKMVSYCPYTWPWNVHRLAGDQRAGRAHRGRAFRSAPSCSVRSAPRSC